MYLFVSAIAVNSHFLALEQRKAEATNIRVKYPDRAPVSFTAVFVCD